MTGAFVPHPGSAPLGTQVWAQARMETRLMLRNGEQLLIALVIPAVALVGLVLGARRLELVLTVPAVDVVTPGVLALAVMSTSFASLAIATGFERRYAVIKRLGASPLPRHGLMLGKIGALVVVELIQFTVLGGLALALGWSPANGWLPGVALVGAGTAAFASLGLLMAGVLRPEATLAAANLGYLLLLGGGAVVLPSSTYGSVGALARLLPSGALGDGLRTAFLDGRTDWAALGVLLGWVAVGAVLTAWTFRWE
jgi:ABC-2 type transport system permease protein